MTLLPNGGANSPQIAIRGARVHNLRSISLDLPHGALIVCTGVSGSGKSSLAFDTLFAEGQRRVLGTLGPSARQRISLLPRPPLESLAGLPPVIAVGQRNAVPSPRGTLATLAEIAPFLRLLFARGGVAHCPQCHQPVVSQTLEEIVTAVCAGESGRRALLLANVSRNRRGSHRETLAQLARQGLVRARVNGDVIDLSLVTELPKGRLHTVDAVIDRVVLREGLQQRLRDSLALALRVGDGACIVSTEGPEGWNDRVFSVRHTCVPCGLALPGVSPQSLNSNTPEGACPRCAGLGWLGDREPSGESASGDRLCEDCCGERLGPVGRQVRYRCITLPHWLGQTVDSAVESWNNWCREPDALLERTGPQVASRLRFLQQAGLGYLALDRPTNTLSGGELQRARLAGALGAGLVGVCYVLDEPTTGLHTRDTARLLEALRALRDQGNTVIVVEHDVEVMRAADWLIDLGPGAGTEGGAVVAVGTVAEVARHPASQTARFLRPPGSVPVDTSRRVEGRTDQQPIEEVPRPTRESPAIADPQASATKLQTGRRKSPQVGGTAPGQPSAVKTWESPRSSPESASHEGAVTDECGREPRGGLATFLSQVPAPRLELSGVSVRNLQNVRIEIPLQRLVCVTGVSGSGKSSLVMEALVPQIRMELAGRDLAIEATAAARPSVPDGGVRGSLLGTSALARLVVVDQSPPPRAARANPATLSGVWSEIRRLLTRTRDARRLGFGAGRFSRLSPEGRCATCRGMGTRPLPLDWLPDARLECPVCRGSGFNPQTLEVRLWGRNVAELLELSLRDAASVFENFARIAPVLRTFVDLGLGYLTLGQSATSLSGGEAQRVKLACELARGVPEPGAGGTLYVLDEPTTGLHPADIERLRDVLRRLVHLGHTVLTIEHQLDLVAAADWLIDLGPGGGASGGRVVASGPPLEVAHAGVGQTALALRQHVGWGAPI